VQIFYFMPRLDIPMVHFDLYAEHHELTLDEFCEICLIPSDGDLREPRPEEFEDFLRTLTVGEFRGISKARVTSLHFPAVHYFALFIGKCLTAREEGGTLSAPDLAILRRAIHGDNTFSLGAIIARRLHTNRSRGAIYGGIYATRLARHFNVNIRPHDPLLPKVRLDFESMKHHHFLSDSDDSGRIQYNLVYNEDTMDIIPLPAPALFDVHARNGYTVMPEDIVTYRAAMAAAAQGPQGWDAQIPPPEEFPPGPDGFFGWQ
jgi:hypothetical protein